MIRSILLAATACAGAVAAPASAATYLFTISGAQTASFKLQSTVAPTLSSRNYGFYIEGVTGSFGGLANLSRITFVAAARGGGLSFTDVGWDFYGAQLYTGSVASPTFRLGTFALSTTDGAAPVSSLLIQDAATAAVPEPAGWALMITGFALAGAALRRRHVRIAFA